MLLFTVVTVALTGATVSTTTGSFTDEETVSLGEVEAANNWTDSPNADNESQSSETIDGDGTEGDENGTRTAAGVFAADAATG